ncbi:hypothetical protein Ancab_025390 [Ancistrocladus abbreviatus]
MAEGYRPVLIDELPSHLILEILTCGRLSAVDLVCLELTSRTFGGSHGVYPLKFRSLVDLAAFLLCCSHSVYASMISDARKELFHRCGGSWKRVLRFLQSVEQASDIVETSAGNMQIKAGRYHTLLINGSSVYSCGSSLCGVLGHGPETTQCVAFSPITFPSSAPVVQVSASHNHAAFVTQFGEVFTCGDNASFCCGHKDTGRLIFRPRLVEALKGIQCNQAKCWEESISKDPQIEAYGWGLSHCIVLVADNKKRVVKEGGGMEGTKDFLASAYYYSLKFLHPSNIHCKYGSFFPISVSDHQKSVVGLGFTVFLTREGYVYTCGSNTHGQLGHGDMLDRPTPKIVEVLEDVVSIVQIAAGHGEQHDELQPRAIQLFRRKDIHVLRVSAGDEHVVAVDSCGYVYTWGKGYCGALGHGDEIDKTTPVLLGSPEDARIAVQTMVLFTALGGWHLVALGFPDRAASDKVMKPRILDSLRSHHISQISTGLYHTVVISNRGRIFGFGDNERAQLGHDMLRGCLKPTEIFLDDTVDQSGGVPQNASSSST